MSVSKIYSAQPDLLRTSIITIETDISRGLNAFTVVGLPGKAVDEAKDRVASAIKNSGWKSPKNRNEKVVISLAPADVKKDGTGFDLGIALAYLLAAEEIRFDTEGKLFVGELSLDGAVKPVKGVLPMIVEAHKRGFTECFVPKANAPEAALIADMKIYGMESLAEVVAHLVEKPIMDTDSGKVLIAPKKIDRQPKTKIAPSNRAAAVDLSDVAGQFAAKRALEIAIGGAHNVLLFGPAGTGKTMLAQAALSLLPELSFDEALEVSSIYSVYGQHRENLISAEAPFRAPHHTASYVSIIGGGANPRPGEVTLAHKGILFLDELPEFNMQVIESLREPLEESVVRISRAKGSATYPADFILIAAMNPCPCGNFGIIGKQCRCSAVQIERYKRKLSGPIMDRIDIFVEVSKVEYEKLAEKNIGRNQGKNKETVKEITESDVARENIRKARWIQTKRYSQEKNLQKNKKILLNSQLSAKQLNTFLELSDECKKLLNDSAKRLDLSARAYHRVIKTARTIGDLAGSEEIKPDHILEALQYRGKLYK